MFQVAALGGRCTCVRLGRCLSGNDRKGHGDSIYLRECHAAGKNILLISFVKGIFINSIENYVSSQSYQQVKPFSSCIIFWGTCDESNISYNIIKIIILRLVVVRIIISLLVMLAFN